MMRLRRRAADQDGAYTIQTLSVLVALFCMIAIVVQLFILFMNGILVNHALGLAAQEASARGGVDQVVDTTFRRHLPGSVDCESVDGTPGCLQVDDPAFDHLDRDFIRPGQEQTASGETATISFRYTESLSLLSWLPGIPQETVMQASASIASQSAQEAE